MAFFNKTEDVLEVVLTPYGRKKLMEGKLKPAYYSFHDDSVLYDGLYGGIVEEQSDIEPRIKNTPTSRNQTTYAGVETHLQSMMQPSVNRSIQFANCLGNSSLHSQYAPAISLKILDNHISGSVNFLTGAIAQMPIPQIDVDIKFTTQIKEHDNSNARFFGSGEEEFEGEFDGASMLDFRTGPFPDGTFVEIIGQQALLQLLEFNAPFEKDNFTVECYMIKDDSSVSGSYEEYIPLAFSDEFDEDDPSFVDYYLDITIDNGIDERELCRLIPKDKRKGVFLRDEFDCLEGEKPSVNINDVYAPSDGAGEGDIC
jgi:hypothetical protein